MKLQSLILPALFGLAADIAAATVPGAPTNVTAVSWPNTAIISFVPPADNGGAAITKYTVTAVGAAWITGSGPASPILVQGGWSTDPHAFTVTATNSAGTGPASDTSNAVLPSGDTSAFIYGNGIFYWAGDWGNAGGTACYGDTSGHPVGGASDLMFRSNGSGFWSPWAASKHFVLAAFKYLQMDLKPTTDNKTWSVTFEIDKTDGTTATIPRVILPGTYGPIPQKGQWATYSIPLSVLNMGPGTTNPDTYKLMLGDGALTVANVWYANNVGFTAEPLAVRGRAAANAPGNRSMTVSVCNETINFAAKNAGTVTVYDLVGNQLASMHAGSTCAGLSWTAKSTGAYLVRFEGAAAAGAIETQRILVK